MKWIGFAIAAIACYVLSSAIAFVAMYYIGPRFPSRLAAAAFRPLEWLATKSDLWRDTYNGLHFWAYRQFGPRRSDPRPSDQEDGGTDL